MLRTTVEAAHSPATRPALNGAQNDRQARAWESGSHLLLPVAITVCGVAASWLVYGDRDLTVDEGYTLTEAGLPLPDLGRVLTNRELNASAHTLLIWAFHHAFDGPAAILLRVPSLLAAAAGSLILYQLARRRFGSAPAVLALLATALNPLVLAAAATGRAYAFTVLLTTISTLLVVELSTHPSPFRYLAWSAVLGVSLYTHFFMAGIVIAQWLWLAIVEPKAWRSLGSASVALGTTSLPIGWFFLSGGGAHGQIPLRPPLSWHDYVSTVVNPLAAGAKGERAWQALASRARGDGGSRAPGHADTEDHDARPSHRRPSDRNSARRRLSHARPVRAAPPRHDRPRHGSRARSWSLDSPSTDGSPHSPHGNCCRSRRPCGEHPPLRSHRTPHDAPWMDRRHGLRPHRSRAGGPCHNAGPLRGERSPRLCARGGLTFTPSTPRTSTALLEQSSYEDVQCVPAIPPGTNVFVLSTQSPQGAVSILSAGACAGLHLVATRHVSYVTVYTLTH